MQVAGAVVDDGDALHYGAALANMRRPRASASFACASVASTQVVGAGWTGRRSATAWGISVRVGSQCFEEAALGVLGVAAGHGADEAPAAPLERGAVERAGFEAEDDLDDEQQRVADVSGAGAGQQPDEQARADSIDGELEPHALPQQPQRRHQCCQPGVAVLDEDKLLGAFQAIGRYVRRLMHVEDDQRRSSYAK